MSTAEKIEEAERLLAELKAELLKDQDPCKLVYRDIRTHLRNPSDWATVLVLSNACAKGTVGFDEAERLIPVLQAYVARRK